MITDEGTSPMSGEGCMGLDVHQAAISVAVRHSRGNIIMDPILEIKASTILELSCRTPADVVGRRRGEDLSRMVAHRWGVTLIEPLELVLWACKLGSAAGDAVAFSRVATLVSQFHAPISVQIPFF